MAHEDLNREQKVEISSDRSFGLVMGAAFAILALWPLASGGLVRMWSAYVAIAFAILAVLRPAVLHGANRLWARLGLLMGVVVSPVVLGVLFYLVFAPMGLAMRAFGKDPLRLALDRDATTYWIEREPPGPQPGSLSDQF